MSYYSRIDLFDVQVRPEKLDEVAAAIKSAKQGGNQAYGIRSLLLEPDGELMWNWDESAVEKWQPDEPLVGALAKWCSRGWVAFWSCEGDGGQWAYELDGKGGYSECSARRVSALRGAETRMLRRLGTDPDS